ncbi:hypothetical protein [Bacterioplanoides sp.]|uniref:hypothetical protein n=1 Tax=Bacterioplanoides sp. TaxID=2066072 RepID=UPI003B595285
MNENTVVLDESNSTGSHVVLLIAIGLSGYIWDLSFNLGAFNSVFLGHYIAIWLFSLSVLFVSITAPGALVPGNKVIGYFLLTLPSLWLILRIIDDASIAGKTTDMVMHSVGVLAIGISLPYLVYLFFHFTCPEVLRLRGRLLVGLMTIVVVSGSLGFALGRNNHLIMTCENFVVSGQDTPANCVKTN